jgi:hypothetical protein
MDGTGPARKRGDGMIARTQDEIVARIGAIAADDWLGWSRNVLIGALDFDHAKPYLKDDVTAEQWAVDRMDDVEKSAREYLHFAIGKILDHRGISAGRSVDKLREYAWLMGRDDVVAAMEAADYPNYGAPKVKAFTEGMGWPWPGDGDVDDSDAAALDRMADGDSCTDGCEAGCGL